MTPKIISFRAKSKRCILSRFLFLSIVTAFTFSLPSYGYPNVEVTVDFANPEKDVKSMSGFLHGIDGNKPLANTITPLRPNLWRVRNSESNVRISEMGARTELVLSDNWGYAFNKTDRDNGAPYNDYSRWEKYVRRLARENQNQSIIWDIWNEPNIKYWQGTREQFFETYGRAHKVIREVLGSKAVIAGPSITHYDKEFIISFLEYCKSKNLEVNVLTWHELEVDKEIPFVEEHLKDARKNFLENSRYANLKIKEIHINEVIGESAQYLPGEIIGYLYYLEKGRSDAASKACWLDSENGSNCVYSNLDGLLNPKTFEPRAAWWAYKAYADGFNSRVKTTSSDKRIVALSSKSKANFGKEAQVLIGYIDFRNSPPKVSINVKLNNLQQLVFLGKRRKIHVKVEQIPNLAELSVKHLNILQQGEVSFSKNSVRILLPQIWLHEAYILTIS